MTWLAAEFENRNMFKSLTRGGKMKRWQMVVCLCWVLLPVSLKQHGLCWVVISSFSFLSRNDSAETVLFYEQHGKTFPNEFEKRRNHAADLWRKQKTLCFALHSTFIQPKLNSIHRILQMENQCLLPSNVAIQFDFSPPSWLNFKEDIDPARREWHHSDTRAQQ